MTIDLDLRQRQITREMLESGIEQLRTAQREGFYSQINARRLAAALSVLKLLEGK